MSMIFKMFIFQKEAKCR